MPLPARRRPSPVRLRSRRRHHQPRARRRWLRRAAAGLASALATAALGSGWPGVPGTAATAPAAAEDAPLAYRPPVDAPVLDPFRAPAGPYGPGNRGIEYGTRPGTAVGAAAAGVVAFAGPVAGALHVSVDHPDGVRTSYSFLATVGVVVGQRVAGGDVLGTSTDRLHLGARRDGAYIDPATLFAPGLVVVELLPLDGPPAQATAGVPAPAPAPSPDTGGPGPAPPTTARVADATVARRPCSSGPAPPRPVAGRGRVAVTVGGLGSSSTSGAIGDLRIADLGYDAGRVVRFSYAGGRTPSSGRALPGLAASDYAAGDTHGDVVATGARLADLIDEVARADPAAVIDVFAHSLGGVVARLALIDLAARGFDVTRLGIVVTLASPHGGADLASAAVGAAARPGGQAVLDRVERLFGPGVDPRSTVVAQLAEDSAVVTGLAAAGTPPGVQLVSIAARGDVVVASPHTRVAGATNVTVPLAGRSAHGGLVGSDEATAEIARALAGRPPGCESWMDVAVDLLTGHVVSAVEDRLGNVATGAPWRAPRAKVRRHAPHR